MKREIEVIRYLLDEIEKREREIKHFRNTKPLGTWEMPPAKSLIVDNTKKIRQLALKIRQEGENL